MKGLRAALGVLALCACSTLQGAGADDPLADSLAPDPALGPAEVVRIQLDALRHNDASDRGIAVAFRFASPANRALTGPLPRFARMLKEGPYRLMLSWVAIDFGELHVEGDDAAQLVTLFGPDESMTYAFRLRRQAEGPCPGCWMTSAVVAWPAAARAVRAPRTGPPRAVRAPGTGAPRTAAGRA